MSGFRPKEFLPVEFMTRLTDARVNDPDRPLRVARTRRRRARLTIDGRLSILAADHPARRVLTVGQDALGMADRHDYLSRIVRVLSEQSVDGVMATMDILEDLLVLHELLVREGRPPLVDNKVLIASLNRGGLLGVSWEMDDPMTGATPATVAEWGFEGAKVLLRVCDEDRDSLTTMMATARVITEMNALSLPVFLEPLPAIKSDHGYKVVKNAEALAKVVSVASALGDSSRYLWLKLPYCENYEIVSRSTTLPILLLGGESAGDPTRFLSDVAAAMAAGHNVRGVLVGRNVLYPGNDDPAAVASSIGRIIHPKEMTV